MDLVDAVVAGAPAAELSATLCRVCHDVRDGDAFDAPAAAAALCGEAATGD